MTLSIVAPVDGLDLMLKREMIPLERVRSTPNGLPIASVGITDADRGGIAEAQGQDRGQPPGVDAQHGEVVGGVDGYDAGSTGRSSSRSWTVTPVLRSAPSITW